MDYRDRGKEGYLGKMRRIQGIGAGVGRFGSSMAKAVFTKPKAPTKQNGKVKYGVTSRRKYVRPNEVKKYVASMKGLSKKEKTKMELRLGNLIYRPEFGKRRHINMEKLEAARKMMIPLIGERDTNHVMKELGVGEGMDHAKSLYAGGKSRTLKATLDQAMRANISTGKKDVARLVLERLDPQPQTGVEARYITEKKLEGLRGDIEKMGQPRVLTSYDKVFGRQEIESKEKDQLSPEQRAGYKRSLSYIERLRKQREVSKSTGSTDWHKAPTQVPLDNNIQQYSGKNSASDVQPVQNLPDNVTQLHPGQEDASDVEQKTA